MVSYEGSLETDWSQAAVFAYLSDFSNTPEWDPGTVESVRLDDGDLREGARFKVVARFLGRNSELDYRMTFYSPSRIVALRGENKTVISNDRITVEPTGPGARVTYRAELTFKGAARFAEPLLKLAFKRVGDNALDGLRKTLASKPAPPPGPAQAKPQPDG